MSHYFLFGLANKLLLSIDNSVVLDFENIWKVTVHSKLQFPYVCNSRTEGDTAPPIVALTLPRPAPSPGIKLRGKDKGQPLIGGPKK